MQLHQIYFQVPKYPPRQKTESSLGCMLQNPEDMSIFHFIADLKPKDIFEKKMRCLQGWLDIFKHLKNERKECAKITGHGIRSANSILSGST